MFIKNILVVKETQEEEARVALTPKIVSALSSQKYYIWVEKDAGIKAGFSNLDYINAGAKIFVFSKSFPPNALIIRVKRPNKIREILENKMFRKEAAMIGFLDPLDPNTPINSWQSTEITVFSVDLFKNISTDDPRNMQAAMSRIAGRLAFQDGLKRCKNNQKIPKLTVIGTGPAALSAIHEAIKARVPAQIFGRREKYRKIFESTGAKYYVIPKHSNQVKFIQNHLKDETIIITAARTPGEKAPLLINTESIGILQKGAIVIDLSVNEGGSVEGSKSDQVVISNGVTIVHQSGYPKLEPKEASEIYAKCMFNLLTEIISPEGEIFFEHELLKESCLMRSGNLIFQA